MDNTKFSNLWCSAIPRNKRGHKVWFMSKPCFGLGHTLYISNEPGQMAHKCPSLLSHAKGLPEVCALSDEGISEGNKVCPIEVIKSNCMSVCWHQWIDTTDGIHPVPQPGSSQCFWSDLYQWINFSCCSAPLVLFFLASLSCFILFLPVQVLCSALLLCPLLFPPYVERMTSSCSHLEGLCLCCEQNSFLTETGPDSAVVHSSCSGSASESWGRQPCASGAAHMALWRSKEWAVTNQDYTTIK